MVSAVQAAQARDGVSALRQRTGSGKAVSRRQFGGFRGFGRCCWRLRWIGWCFGRRCSFRWGFWHVRRRFRRGAAFGGASGGGIVPTARVGNGWRLILQEGPFGRTGGIWPELASCRYVSGNHGRISKTSAGWQVEDCGSTNGTFVNGVRVQKQILKRGDILRIATLDFTLE